MNIQYKVIQQIIMTFSTKEEMNEIKIMRESCKENGLKIIKEGSPINPETLLPDITQYVIVAEAVLQGE